jgi:hypothetical protein
VRLFPRALYGLEFSPSGARLYCSGAADGVIHVFDFKDDKLRANQRVPLHDARQASSPYTRAGPPRQAPSLSRRRPPTCGLP